MVCPGFTVKCPGFTAMCPSLTAMCPSPTVVAVFDAFSLILTEFLTHVSGVYRLLYCVQAPKRPDFTGMSSRIGLRNCPARKYTRTDAAVVRTPFPSAALQWSCGIAEAQHGFGDGPACGPADSGRPKSA